MTAESARGEFPLPSFSSVHSDFEDVSHICKVNFNEEEDALGIKSSSTSAGNDIVAIRHLNRVTIIQNNKILVTMVYPSAVTSMTFSNFQVNVTALWALTSSKELYCSEISKYVFRKSETDVENVFGDLLGNFSEASELPLVVVASDSDVWRRSDDKDIFDFIVIGDILIIFKRIHEGLSCSLWVKGESVHNDSISHALYKHAISRSDLIKGKMVICAVSAWTIEIEKDIQKKWLNKDLYNSLFGLDNNLVDSIVLLIGTQSGIVWSCCTKLYKRSEQICDLGQPIIGIECIKGQDTEECRTLAIFGQSGKVMFIRHTENGLLYQSWFTTFPVLDVTVSGSALIHSTGYGLFVTDVNQLANDCNPRPCIQSSKLPLNNIIHLVSYSDMKGLSVTQGAQVAGLTRNGELLNIKLHFTKQREDINTGNDMKYLMTSLSTMTKQLNQIQEKLANQDKVLSQINLASMIIAQQKNKLFVNQKILDCVQEVKTTNHGSHVSHKVLLTLRNVSDVVFDDGWKWIVTVQSKNENARSKHTSQYGIGLGQLRPGEFRMMDVNMDYDLLEDLPFRSDFQLIYTNFSQSSPVRIPVWLESKELNILQFLSAIAPSHNKQSVRSLINSSRKSNLMGEAETTSTTRTFSASITVSEETCLKATKLTTTDIDATPECLLLKYLMAESDVQLTASSNSILLKFVDKNYLTMHIDSENHGNYVINLQSASITVLSLARLAISDRIQAVKVKDKKEEYKLDRRKLSIIMKKINDIQERCFQMDELVMEGLDSATITNSLLDLHETLRNISLPL